MIPPLRTNAQSVISFLRLMVYILFFPFFILMDPHLPSQVIYVAGAALIYSGTVYLFPALTVFLTRVLPLDTIIDIVIISITVYLCDPYTGALSILYLFPILSQSFDSKRFAFLLGAALSGLSYLGIVIVKGFFLPTALVQVALFQIFAFYARFLVQHLHQIYFSQANQDTLTKISNRRFFNHTLNRMVNEYIPFSLILIDLDNFKQLNDTQGHHHGDFVLKVVAAILKECTRSYDIASRYGGDEFAIILPHSSKEAGRTIAERIRNNVLVNPRLMAYPHISISLGIASFPDDAKNAEEIIQKADETLYKAKNLGKNCVCVY